MGDDYVPTMLQRLHVAFMQTKKNMQEARNRNKERISKKAVASSFEPGDSVFYYDKTTTTGEATKLKLSWVPHYRMVEQTSPVNYLIRNHWAQ